MAFCIAQVQAKEARGPFLLLRPQPEFSMLHSRAWLGTLSGKYLTEPTLCFRRARPPTPESNTLLHQDFFLQDHWLGNTGSCGERAVSGILASQPVCAEAYSRTHKCGRNCTAGSSRKGRKQKLSATPL